LILARLISCAAFLGWQFKELEMDTIADGARRVRALLIALTLSAAIAMPGAAIGQLQSGDSDPPVQDAAQEDGTGGEETGDAVQAQSQTWHAVDPPVVEELRKANPKIPLQIVVASAEEIANQGVRGNGRVIYRIVNGILQIVVIDPAAAAELAKSFPDLAPAIIAAMPSAQEAVLAVVGPETQTDEIVEQKVAGADPKDPPAPPSDFIENPARDNISPS
jgi:hypothetical protein